MRGRRPARPRRPADARRDRRHALRPHLPLHGLRADRRGDRAGGGDAVNLALSLLAAAERTPDAEALPGHHVRRSCASARRGSPAGLGLEPGERLAVVLDNRVEAALLYWAAQWCGAVFVPLSWRASQDDLDYCIEDCGARVVLREGDSAPRRPRASRRARPRRARAEPDALHVGHDRAAEGRAPLAPRRPRRRPRPGAPARLPLRRPDARRDAALPHDGHPLARSRCSCSAAASSRQARWDAGRALRLIEERADHVALPRPHALLRPRPPPARWPSTTSPRSRRSATPAPR